MEKSGRQTLLQKAKNRTTEGIGSLIAAPPELCVRSRARLRFGIRFLCDSLVNTRGSVLEFALRRRQRHVGWNSLTL